ncbi:MAG: hypothetical protein DUD27_00900 [Lachnospiraceae bacterium]|uniref:Phasin family protein n=1 Tax=Candidatus Weimeria bifida TaxID=2599074 RepID=A0A6N7IYE6_9FIRM|nr:hypothetical protein [Candidatus Weimeria bifida]RRF97149.1 MAG: hypothetical protein DUD27_00900 [Lachnospiraceae bacterium]
MANDDEIFTGALKKVFLAGVGAVAATADKSEEIFNDLVEKGESTVSQGKSLNKELKHTVKDRVKADRDQAKKSDNPIRDLNAILAGMTAEQLDALKDRIDDVKSNIKGDKKDDGKKESDSEDKNS